MPVDTKDILYMLAKQFDLGRDDTKKRLILQKTIYLLQAYGLKLGYGFSWYKYGPYSQELVQDAYEVLHFSQPSYGERTKSLKFSKASIQKFENFKKICRDVLGEPEDLELIASVHFALTTWYPDVDDQKFVSQFKMHKSFLYGGKEVRDDEVQKALEVAKKLKAQTN